MGTIRMNKIIQIALFWAAGLLACAGTNTTSWADGAYPGYAGGCHGRIQVAVVVRKGRIDRIELGRHKEKRSKQMAAMVRKIVEQQSLEVDAVSGATISCDAVKRAVKNALDQAR